MLNLILFGPPGSGKGTQAANLIDKYGLLHISTGDLFRFEIGNNTPLGIKAKEYMSKGELVPDEVTIGMLKNKVEANPDAIGIIFDGFPRTLAQAEALDSYLASKNTEITALIAMDVAEEELIERILHRAKTSGRPDDADAEIIKNRICVYKEETAPIFDYYALQNKSILINGTGTIDEIFESLTEAVESIC